MLSQNTLAIRLSGRFVGTLTRLVNETIVFAFDPEYASDLKRPVLSLSFKGPMGALVSGRTRIGTRLTPFFSNLLPEGHLRSYLAARLSINTDREFFLLAALGEDLPGAVTALPLGELPMSAAAQDQNKAAQMTRFRFSLAGVQLKFSAVKEASGTFTIPAAGCGGSWIVKLPSERYLQVPEAEFSMLELARLAGIAVPEFKLIATAEIEGLPDEFRKLQAKSLAVKRFDRTDSGGRVHMEDFAQVYGIYPQDKYERAGYAHIGRVLWAEDEERSYGEFLRRLVFTVATGNGDMHLKNWSLLYSDPQRPVISPSYDLVPTIAYIDNDSLGLNLGGTKNFCDITREKFVKMALSAKAPERLTSRIVDEAIEAFLNAWRKNRSNLLLPDQVLRKLDSHLDKLPLFKSRQSRGSR